MKGAGGRAHGAGGDSGAPALALSSAPHDLLPAPSAYDIAIVGAGAAGLTAAIFAKRAVPNARVVLLDGAPKIGAKILISGGGRCNVTHHAVTAGDFNGNGNAIARVLRTFSVEETVRWFADMGVTLKREETGKLFPTTDRARTVVDALLRACEGVDVRTGSRVVGCVRVVALSAESKSFSLFMRSRWALSAHSSEAEPPPSSGLRPSSPPKKRGEKGLDLASYVQRSHSRYAPNRDPSPLRRGEKVPEGRMRGRPRGRYTNRVSCSQARRARRALARDDSLQEKAHDPRLRLLMNDGSAILARRVILATGGKSVPKTGSDGQGYALVRALGHSVTEVFPALVPLVLEAGHWMTALSGTSAEVELSVRSGSGRILTRHRGSMLFTHFGISGPVALDVSRHWIAERGALVASFLPGQTFQSLEEQLIAEAKRNPRATLASVLRGRVPQRLLQALLHEANVPEAGMLGAITREARRRTVRALVETVVPVTEDRGFDYAEVTAGGVPLNEVELSTMASRKVEGLYLCGEIFDVDGRIGGFNFQWAWASGRLAGLDAARSLTTG